MGAAEAKQKLELQRIETRLKEIQALKGSVKNKNQQERWYLAGFKCTY